MPVIPYLLFITVLVFIAVWCLSRRLHCLYRDWCQSSSCEGL